MAQEGPVIQWDEEARGAKAECYGASPSQLDAMLIPEGYRFVGTLTGEYYTDPEWPALKWYRMVELTEKPPDFKENSLWCEWGSTWVLGEGDSGEEEE